MNNDKNVHFPIKEFVLFPFSFLFFVLLIISSFFCHFHSELSYFLSNRKYGTVQDNIYYKRLESLTRKGKKKHETKQKNS